MTGPQQPRIPTSALALEFPMSLGVYDTYEQAQAAVDFLSDHEFPVQNCLIVGTDLRQVERVTGRLTTAKVAAGGALSGVWMGIFVGLIVSLFTKGSTIAIIASTAVFGALFGLVWALAGYAATRGRRDFTSVTRVVATRYEVLVEHKFAAQGREMLARMPGQNPPGF
ncbi:MAG TPA: general stress protein [Marmoricola sp.]|nr:general stress protein [Marmoricola sp.]